MVIEQLIYRNWHNAHAYVVDREYAFAGHSGTKYRYKHNKYALIPDKNIMDVNIINSYSQSVLY